MWTLPRLRIHLVDGTHCDVKAKKVMSGRRHVDVCIAPAYLRGSYANGPESARDFVTLRVPRNPLQWPRSTSAEYSVEIITRCGFENNEWQWLDDGSHYMTQMGMMNMPIEVYAALLFDSEAPLTYPNILNWGEDGEVLTRWSPRPTGIDDALRCMSENTIQAVSSEIGVTMTREFFMDEPNAAVASINADFAQAFRDRAAQGIFGFEQEPASPESSLSVENVQAMIREMHEQHGSQEVDCAFTFDYGAAGDASVRRGHLNEFSVGFDRAAPEGSRSGVIDAIDQTSFLGRIHEREAEFVNERGDLRIDPDGRIRTETNWFRQIFNGPTLHDQMGDGMADLQTRIWHSSGQGLSRERINSAAQDPQLTPEEREIMREFRARMEQRWSGNALREDGSGWLATPEQDRMELLRAGQGSSGNPRYWRDLAEQVRRRDPDGAAQAHRIENIATQSNDMCGDQMDFRGEAARVDLATEYESERRDFDAECAHEDTCEINGKHEDGSPMVADYCNECGDILTREVQGDQK